MALPRQFLKQIAEYERHGFHVVEATPSKGSHYKFIFAEFGAPQFLTLHTGDPRAIKNNIARFKRLAAQEKK